MAPAIGVGGCYWTEGLLNLLSGWARQQAGQAALPAEPARPVPATEPAVAFIVRTPTQIQLTPSASLSDFQPAGSSDSSDGWEPGGGL